PKMNLSTFRLKAQITSSLSGFLNTVDEFAIHGKFDNAVDADDIISVPFASSLAAILNRLASFTSRVIRNCLNSSNAKQFSVNICNGRLHSIACVELHPIEFEHLYLNAIREPRFFIGIRSTPHKDAGVATGLHVFPFDMQ